MADESKPLEGEIVEPPKKKQRGRPKGIPNMENIEFRKARAELMTEWKIKGVPSRDIGNAFNLSDHRVNEILKWARESGMVEEVRQRMSREMLPLAADVYNAILTADVEKIQEVAKGWEVKLKAARQIAEGLGALGKQAVQVTQKQTLDLEGYQKIRQERLLKQQNDVHQQRQVSRSGESPSVSEASSGGEVRSEMPDCTQGSLDWGDGGGGDSRSPERSGGLVGSKEAGTGEAEGTSRPRQEVKNE